MPKIAAGTWAGSKQVKSFPRNCPHVKYFQSLAFSPFPQSLPYFLKRLLVANDKSRPDMVKLLVEKGAKDFGNALREACANDKIDLEVFKFLLERKANVNEIGRYDSSALQNLCKSKTVCIEAIELLLEAGADPNEKLSSDLDCPLYFLCENERVTVELVEYMTKKANKTLREGLNGFVF